MSQTTNWYVVKASAGTCQILTDAELKSAPNSESWGPYATEGEAIAKRVGLIRAGKCQPA
ncbi:hypothetical protein [Leptolyngbya iicbica]|uniref:DDE transposase family protein n=2 Tax=Cyanophyceae TaxID=3028117 RepID=A0A4Q7EGP3_9CYAN|nr:hypothetical protein [Leptolyngbya sp. LK]RZM82257.1 hypothetical protein DYY88_03105 [Leptolyngbya sp. LK]